MSRIWFMPPYLISWGSRRLEMAMANSWFPSPSPWTTYGSLPHLAPDGTRLWNPDWLQLSTSAVNEVFLKEVANVILKNERVSVPLIFRQHSNISPLILTEGTNSERVAQPQWHCEGCTPVFSFCSHQVSFPEHTNRACKAQAQKSLQQLL